MGERIRNREEQSRGGSIATHILLLHLYLVRAVCLGTWLAYAPNLVAVVDVDEEFSIVEKAVSSAVMVTR